MTPFLHHEKIRAMQDLADLLSQEKKNGKTVVQCHGVFDLLHPGHIRHFAAAKKDGDILVVTVTPDRFVNKGPGRPVFPEALRAESIAALAMVDYVAINEYPTAVEAIALLKPDVYMKGGEYSRPEDDVTGKIAEEAVAVRQVGGRIAFTDDITFSSSSLLNTHFSDLSTEAQSFLGQFRTTYDAASLTALLQSLKSMKVLVVGDTIIDEYHMCRIMGRASKTAALNARYISSESHAGGVLAVANHVAGLCDTVHLVTVLGAQESKLDFVEASLKTSVSTKFFLRPDGPTTVKRRFTDPFMYQKMFEVTFLQDQPLPSDVADQVNDYLASVLPQYDLVLVADFGHGLIGTDTVKILCAGAKFLAVNAQTNSANMGFNPITKYPRADYVCIDQEEMRLAYHDRFGPLEPLVDRAAEEFTAKYVTVTQGDQGSITYKSGDGMTRVPVVSSRRTVDTIGAGDAFLSYAAPCAAAGFDPAVIGLVGNAAGAMASQVLGNKESVDSVALIKFVTRLLK